MVAQEQEMMSMDKKDPLIDLKQQELMLRAQQLQQNKQLSENIQTSIIPKSKAEIELEKAEKDLQEYVAQKNERQSKDFCRNPSLLRGVSSRRTSVLMKRCGTSALRIDLDYVVMAKQKAVDEAKKKVDLEINEKIKAEKEKLALEEANKLKAEKLAKKEAE